MLALTLGLASFAVASAASAQSTLRIALREDPDVLDPTLARTYVGRIVFMSLCDKLFDIDDKLNIVPQLATGFTWSGDAKTLTIKLRDGVVFHDGEKMDAAAVKFSLDRHRTMQGSFRRPELSVVTEVEVADPLTVNLKLSQPFAPLVAQLTDRAGMIVSPKAAQEAGANFGNKPVCAGPFKFVDRVALDRITVERFPQYWDKDRIHLDRVVYQIIPDGTVRLANLQSGAVEFVELLQATDIPAVRRNNRLKLSALDEIGYQGITLNVANGERSKGPIGNAKVREAFELAIDRSVITQVVYNGEYTPGNQWVAPNSAYYQKAFPIPARNVNRAKELLREAGHPNPVVTLMVPNNPEQRQVGEVVQAMAREAGFDLRIQATEFASSLNAAERGDFEAYLLGWSGRTDPDGNITSFVSCTGPLNYSKFCDAEIDKLLTDSRGVSDVDKRKAIYEEIARKTLTVRPIVYIFHRKNLHAYSSRVDGFTANPDGLVRLQNVKLAAN